MDETDAVRLATERELALLSFDVRRSAAAVEDLLDPEFREIGASGRLWTRAEMAAALAGDLSDEEGSIAATEFQGMTLAPDLVLLTYVSDRNGRRARRSSVWRRSKGSWRVLHHQGTLLSD
ncbi:DUF4440 domain-containing protein [uncultured Pseudonocardia sp.]|uniref:nuclear transport factor 2 family protein n=1 Tax=uncultured Pseudonocardia sp. TaxID=211455 RepID=UPI00261AE9D1|nr:DUF4440 domain-containing protein [uncultured Pseudonocardia sp.]